MATNQSRRLSGEHHERVLGYLKRQLPRRNGRSGDLGEGIALDSMRHVLEERFGTTISSLGVTARRAGRWMRVDAFAYSASVACVVDIRERLTEDSSEQLLQVLHDFRHFFPEHRDKTVFGILAFANAPKDIRDQALDAGIYLARIQDGQFEIQVPPDFRPRAF